ncbi:MAG: hypothetical protein HQ482_04850 [Sphingomonadales bacterium]|nr:hypothetical protein [Sphingomonadales bacterium]
MSNVANISPALSPLQELQKAFYLLKLSGDVVIVDQKQIEDVRSGIDREGVQMFRMTPGKLLLRRFLEALPLSSDPGKAITDFMVSPKTTVYDRIAFSPLSTPLTTLNLWSGPTAIPRQGDWGIIKSFLLEVIADGDISLYRYLTLFLAQMLQAPEDKPGVVIAMIGGQGTGKGSALRIVERIWSNSTLLVSDVDHVIGRFNAALEGNFAICMDEAMFAGDRRAMDRLKSLVTEPTITIEQKNQPRRSIDSYHRFFSATNHAHFAHVEADDRRLAFFHVSDKRQGDQVYWNQVYQAINDPTAIAAMVYDLERYDLSNFDVRQRPKNAAHMGQKLKSLTGFDRYWYEVLISGDFDLSTFGEPIDPWCDTTFISTKRLLEGWKRFEKGQRQFYARQQSEMHDAIQKLCSSAEQGRKTVHNKQLRGYFLPPLATARREFADAMGGTIEWED